MRVFSGYRERRAATRAFRRHLENALELTVAAEAHINEIKEGRDIYDDVKQTKQSDIAQFALTIARTELGKIRIAEIMKLQRSGRARRRVSEDYLSVKAAIQVQAENLVSAKAEIRF